MIVKVQLPVVTDNPEPGALVYDEKRKVKLHVPVTRVLFARMACRPDHPFAVGAQQLKDILPDGPRATHYALKKFFHADVAGKSVELGDEAGMQSW